MSIVNLAGYQVREFSIKNALPSGTKISMQTKYSYNVKFADSASHCRGEITCELCDKENPDNFALRLVMQGLFTFKPGSERAIVHVESFKALFPYARSYVSMVSAASGMPPIMLPDVDIESQSIYSFEKPKPNTPEN